MQVSHSPRRVHVIIHLISCRFRCAEKSEQIRARPKKEKADWRSGVRRERRGKEKSREKQVEKEKAPPSFPPAPPPSAPPPTELTNKAGPTKNSPDFSRTFRTLVSSTRCGSTCCQEPQNPVLVLCRFLFGPQEKKKQISSFLLLMTNGIFSGNFLTSFLLRSLDYLFFQF